MEENYLTAKQAIFSQYANSAYYPLFVVSLYSLLEKYPNYQNLILYLFRQVEIFIEEDSVGRILNKNSISFFSFDEEEELETFGISSPEDVVLLKDDDLVHVTKPPVIICSNLGLTHTELLNIFLHEMNHLIKGKINSFYFHKDGPDTYCASRTGLNTHYYHYNKDSWNLWETDDFDIFDEVINTMQSTELTQHVFSLENIMIDDEIQFYLNSLNQFEATVDFGYEEATRIIRPLWKDNYFKSLIEKNIVEGNISTIIEEYDSIMGEGSFFDLGSALDMIDSYEAKGKHGKKYKAAKKYIKNAIKYFPKEKRKILS